MALKLMAAVIFDRFDNSQNVKASGRLFSRPISLNAHGLASTAFEAWAKERYEIATMLAYRNGAQLGIPRGGRIDCAMVAAALVRPLGRSLVQTMRRPASRQLFSISG